MEVNMEAALGATQEIPQIVPQSLLPVLLQKPALLLPRAVVVMNMEVDTAEMEREATAALLHPLALGLRRHLAKALIVVATCLHLVKVLPLAKAITVVLILHLALRLHQVVLLQRVGPLHLDLLLRPVLLLQRAVLLHQAVLLRQAALLHLAAAAVGAVVMADHTKSKR